MNESMLHQIHKDIKYNKYNIIITSDILFLNIYIHIYMHIGCIIYTT